jgi:putative thioredoxin
MEHIINPDGTISEAADAAPPADLIKESDTQRFMADVIETSMQVPVIVDFWAPWCGPCKQLTPLLERLVRQAGGAVRLVKVNVDENQQLAGQMRVQSIPSVYAFFQGQPVDAFVGAQPESQIRAFIGRLTGGQANPVDQALERAQAALDGGDAATAADVFGQILEHDPESAEAAAGLIRARAAAGDAAGARQVADGLAPALKDNGKVQAALNALELAEGSTAAGDIAELEARVAAEPSDHQARFDLAAALFAGGRAEDAVDHLLEIVGRDREWNDQAARGQLIKMFDALGATHPLTVSGRRRLSSILFS